MFISPVKMNMLGLPRWRDVQPLSEKDIGVIAVSKIPAGTKFGPYHGTPNVLDKATEDRKISYSLEVKFFLFFSFNLFSVMYTLRQFFTRNIVAQKIVTCNMTSSADNF